VSDQIAQPRHYFQSKSPSATSVKLFPIGERGFPQLITDRREKEVFKKQLTTAYMKKQLSLEQEKQLI
jgi:predicted metal-dependent TIM-barrel fold hydrolase